MAASGDTKNCVACAEEILAAALLCKHCKTDQRDSRFLVDEITENQPISSADESSKFESDEPAMLVPEFDETNNGLAMATSDPSKTFVPCRICGKEVNPSSEHCSNCGASLKREIRPESVNESKNETLGEDVGGETEETGVDSVRSKGLMWTTVLILGSLALVLSLFPNEFALNQSGSSPSSRPYSADAACADLSGIYNDYFDEFNEFRYSADDGSGWARLEELTNKATRRLSSAISRVNKGIEWDSSGVVASLLTGVSNGMTEIVSSAKAGGFSPGRSLDVILTEIDTTLKSVATSACN